MREHFDPNSTDNLNKDGIGEAAAGAALVYMDRSQKNEPPTEVNSIDGAKVVEKEVKPDSKDQTP